MMTRLVHVLLAISALTTIGCSDDEGSSGTSATTVNLALREFAIAATPNTVKAGAVKFVATNTGEDVHEVVFVKTDLAIAQLPKNTDGTFNEDGQGVAVIDEIEDVDPGKSVEKTLTLAAGHHVLVCNVVQQEDAGQESHFHEGMLTDLTVQ